MRDRTYAVVVDTALSADQAIQALKRSVARIKGERVSDNGSQQITVKRRWRRTWFRVQAVSEQSRTQVIFSCPGRRGAVGWLDAHIDLLTIGEPRSVLFLNEGERFAIGDTGTTYGVWDLDDAVAVAVFRRTAGGWRAASARYGDLEAGAPEEAGALPAASPRRAAPGPRRPPRRRMKDCPRCGRRVRAAAKTCRFCHHRFAEAA